MVLLYEPVVVTVELVKIIKDLTLIWFYMNLDSLLPCLVSAVWLGAESVTSLFPPSP